MPVEAPPTYIRLADVPALPWMPAGRTGARVSVETVHKWRSRGVGGKRLRTANVGGSICTTENWLHEFIEAIGGADAEEPASRESNYRELVKAVGFLMPNYHDLVRVVGHQQMARLKELWGQLFELQKSADESSATGAASADQQEAVNTGPVPGEHRDVGIC